MTSEAVLLTGSFGAGKTSVAVERGEGAGAGLEDVTVDNDRPLRDVAIEVVRLLGWG